MSSPTHLLRPPRGAQSGANRRQHLPHHLAWAASSSDDLDPTSDLLVRLRPQCRALARRRGTARVVAWLTRLVARTWGIGERSNQAGAGRVLRCAYRPGDSSLRFAAICRVKARTKGSD